MSILKVRSSSLLLTSGSAASIFKCIREGNESFYRQNRRYSALRQAVSRHEPKVSLSAACFHHHQSQKCSSAKVITSPYRDIKAPCDSLIDFIWKDVNKWSGHTAISSAETDQNYSYEELRRLCRRFAVALKQKGFQKGEILSIILPNIPEYLIVLLGTIEAGLVATTLNPAFTADEISRQLQNSETSVIVTLSSLTGLVYSAEKLIEARTKAPFQFALITLQDWMPGRAMDLGLGQGHNFEEMVDERLDGYELRVKISGDDVALLPYSSGTTGFPKGVQLTHSNLVHNLLQICTGDMKHVQETSGEFQEVLPAVLPFFHIFGISSVILTSIMHGCKMVSLSRFNPESYAKVIKDEKVTMLHLVPTLSYFLTSHPLIKPNHLDAVRLLFFAGANTPISEVEKITQLGRQKMRIINAYGLTEASPAVCAKIGYTCDGSVGSPLANTVVKIIDNDGSHQCSFKNGEICVKGPQIMKGYFRNASATDNVIDSDGFLHTGDIGYYSNDNYIFFADRLKELIKVKGFQVPPAELESVIKSYEGVQDVAVIGVPDSKCGEIPVAFVVPKLCQQIRENDLKRFVAEKVAPYKQLGRVIVAESIPRNPSGKILRRILREKYEKLS